ncbi:MAG: FliG C-terminal domain-containing protein [Oligoflexia bacterium]|nr:FliG C-terminal domain-containing protein [Oligoflexia bacterium]
MSMLARYRKPGGVQQLLALLETCLSKKRENLINMIIAEDKEFGTMIKSKILTTEKIFKWDPLVVCEATTRLSERTLAICLKGLPPEAFAIATHTLRDLKKREVTNLLEILKPTPIEIESAHIKLVEIVRTLEKEGSLKLDENDVPLKQGSMMRAS